MKLNINIIKLIICFFILLFVIIFFYWREKENFVTLENIKRMPRLCNNQINRIKRKTKAKIINLKKDIFNYGDKISNQAKKMVKKTIFPKEIKITF